MHDGDTTCEATKDVDVLILIRVEAAITCKAVQRVADALGLPDDWRNDAAKVSPRRVHVPRR